MVVLFLNGERGELIIPRINLRCLSIQIHQQQLPVLATAARNRSSLHCSGPGPHGCHGHRRVLNTFLRSLASDVKGVGLQGSS